MMVATAPSIFFVDFILVCLDITGRGGTDEDVVHHPPQHWMSTVGEFPFSTSFISSLVGGDISLKPCPKGTTVQLIKYHTVYIKAMLTVDFDGEHLIEAVCRLVDDTFLRG